MIGLRVGVNAGAVVGAVAGTYTPTVAATLSTGDLDQAVATSGAAWTATLTWQQLGVVGNGKILDIRINTSSPPSVEVRDNQRYDASLGWVSASGTVGVLVGSDVGLEATVGDIEAAINATSTLAQVTTADPTPAKTIDAIMDETTVTGTFSGGV